MPKKTPRSSTGFPPAKEILNEEAYRKAVRARIQQNKRITQHKVLVAAVAEDSLEFRQWLGLEPVMTPEFAEKARALDTAEALAEKAWYAMLDARRATPRLGGDTPEEAAVRKAYQDAERAVYDFHDAEGHARSVLESAFWKRYGGCPAFLRDAINQWGGLTPKQLEYARKIWAERTTKATELAAKRAADRASATPWTAGRQIVTGTVVSIKTGENDYGVFCKLLIKTASGSTLYVSRPSGLEVVKGATVTMTVTITVADTDPTHAFGARPAKASAVLPESSAGD